MRIPIRKISPVHSFIIRLSILIVALVLTSMALAVAGTDEKLKPEQVVAKHLDSLGTAEARASVHGITAKGRCVLTVRQGGNGQVDGQTLIASEGGQSMIKMVFDSADYPLEALTFDGKVFSTSQIRPGVRTGLAQFFLTNDVIFREGIAAGTLSSAWPLLNFEPKNAKLEYQGLKKIGGVQMHALNYVPRKGSSVKITMFFDSETFRHVRTEYARDVTATDLQRIPGGGGRMPDVSSQRSSDAHIRGVEEFSDFKSEGGLTLPHTYKFNLTIQSEVRPLLVDWIITLDNFSFNTPFSSSASGSQ